MPRRAIKKQRPDTAFTRPTRPLSLMDTQTIYCGDNLDRLRTLTGGFVDLVYIDPPFNSNRVYETFWGETKERRAFEDRHASTEAYIQFMRPRCVELARVLKETGSFYYHCDWHASHYVKVMLDQLFGEDNFQNEIVWERFSGKNDAARYGRGHDVIFFYTKSKKGYTWNVQYGPFTEEYIHHNYTAVEEGTGRRYRLSDLTANKAGGDVDYEWRGVKPYKGRHWAYSREKLDQFFAEGRIVFRRTGMPVYKRYLDEMPGVPLQDVWTDIRLPTASKERLGYPTQKPLALLERIIKASSDPDDIVLDAFCGCGTALVAAERLERRWIGIDSSPTACRVMAKRLNDECKLRQDTEFFIVDLPRSIDELRRMPPFEFQNWAVIALGGIPNRKKSNDKGIDGHFYPVASESKKDVKDSDQLGFMHWYPVQVKQQDKAGRPDIDAFETAILREDKQKGIFVSFDYTRDAMDEIRAFFQRSGRVIHPVTVRELMEADATELAMKLA